LSAEPVRVAASWLDLREVADASARSRALVAQLRRRLPARDCRVIHDLACGSGAMGRWLAPLLPGPQHWVLHDRDVDLLALAGLKPPGPAADAAAVTVETRLSDITRLRGDDLEGAALVTASALLDLLTEQELQALVRACAEAACPVLVSLSVTGRVQLVPTDPLDARVVAAFNAHQRRWTGRGQLLGPDAVEAAADAFRAHGAEVVVAASTWRLAARDARLTAEWFTGWTMAAREQDEVLAAELELYRRRRLHEVEAGRLVVTVGHADLLVLP
jgi:trans-aconitate methyltransferase